MIFILINFYRIHRNDYPDVLHYLITTQKCNVLKKDEHGRTLIFLAVMNEKPKILRYLIKRVIYFYRLTFDFLLIRSLVYILN